MFVLDAIWDVCVSFLKYSADIKNSILFRYFIENKNRALGRHQTICKDVI